MPGIYVNTHLVWLRASCDKRQIRRRLSLFKCMLLMVDIFSSPHLLLLHPSSPGASSPVSFSPSLTSPVIHTVPLAFLPSSLLALLRVCPLHLCLCFFPNFLLFPCVHQQNRSFCTPLPFCFTGTQRWSRLQIGGTPKMDLRNTLEGL